MRAKKKASSTGNRYSPAKWREMLSFIKKHGRGGQAKAMKKYGVSNTAIQAQLNKSGVDRVFQKKKANAEKLIRSLSKVLSSL